MAMHSIRQGYLGSFDLSPVSLVSILSWALFQVMALAFAIVGPMRLVLYHCCQCLVDQLHLYQNHCFDQAAAAVLVAVLPMVVFHQILNCAMKIT